MTKQPFFFVTLSEFVASGIDGDGDAKSAVVWIPNSVPVAVGWFRQLGSGGKVVSSEKIDVLVVNVSMLFIVPSLAARIVNKYIM